MKKISLMNRILFVFFVLLYSSVHSQNSDLSILSIPDSLKENANAVVKLNRKTITVQSAKKILVSEHRIVVVLNKKGEAFINANQFYNKSVAINQLEVAIYNQFGQQIKKIKKKDFQDQSLADGFSVFNDARMLRLDYTATEYPYIAEITSEIETSNTAFIPSWMPIEDYAVSVISDEIDLTWPTDLFLRFKDFNFEKFAIGKKSTNSSISFSIKNVKALKMEEFSPHIAKLVPKAMFALNRFNLEGMEGTADNWKNFGQWLNEGLLKEARNLNPETIVKVKNLVSSETDAIAKAKKIYKFVQDKTRYVSIQVGIGGWKPMDATEVDRLGYGDCKALSNYTKALLDAVEIPSYYTLIYGSTSKTDLQQDFVSMQGNHAILTVPHNGKNYFLECTSQTSPFGYQGNFTDDRYALLIKPEGGEIVKTNDVLDTDNTQFSRGDFTVSAEGYFKGNVTIVSKGRQYGSKDGNENKSKEHQTDFYKEYFNTVNNIKLTQIKFHNDKDNVVFQEDISFEADSYGQVINKQLVIPVNPFNVSKSIPQRYRSRKNPFEITRGFFDKDEITIRIPEGFQISALPENTTLTTRFGDYKTEYIVKDKNTVLFTRSFLFKRGYYEKTDYDAFRKFMETVNKIDNSKIAVTKVL